MSDDALLAVNSGDHARLGGRRSKGDLVKLSHKSSMHVEEGKKVYVVDVEATPSRSEAGVGPAGQPLPKLRRQMPSRPVEI
eukprot:2754497-Pleurochrysis_carterae.AAC.1